MKPSVTKLIEMLDKPALMKWANKIGLEGIRLDDYKSKSKESGLSIHEQVENFTKFGLVPDDEGLANKLTKFFSDKQILEIEGNIETEYFTGRFDIKLKWKDFVFICDYKSNSVVYFETKLQLSAYQMATKCDHVAVVHLPDFLLRPVDLNMDLYSHFLIHLSNLYTIKQQIENSK